MTILEIGNYLSNKGCSLRGCSDKEIEKIESFFGVKIPSIYKEFLLTMGKGAGDYMKGSSVFYDEIFELKEGSEELLIDNDFRPLPDDAFVFWMHQGYQLAFFNISDGENPKIYFYYEGKTLEDFEEKESSLTDFFEKQIAVSGL